MRRGKSTKGPTWTTDIDRITDKWYAPYSISRFILLLVVTWFIVFGIYAASVRAVDLAAGHLPSGEFIDPEDYAFVFYGLGALVATLLTPLFGLHFLIDALESRAEDKGLVRAFLKVDDIRSGRKVMEESGEAPVKNDKGIDDGPRE